MFDTFNGLPLHPLVVHAVVVLLPLAVLGAIALVVRPALRERYGWLVVGCAAIATILIPVATSSGESLEKLVGDPGKHAELGDQLLWFAIPLLVLVTAWVWLARVTAPKAVATLVAALTLVTAGANVWQVYRVGDSGAKAAWGGVVATK